MNEVRDYHPLQGHKPEIHNQLRNIKRTECHQNFDNGREGKKDGKNRCRDTRPVPRFPSHIEILTPTGVGNALT